MKIKIAILSSVLMLGVGLIPSNSAGAATDPPAQLQDTCFGQHPTIIKWTLDKTTNLRVLQGTIGDDVIIGTDGNDLIHGGGGNDVICARGGNDTVDWNPWQGYTDVPVQVDLGGGNDTLYPSHANSDTGIAVTALGGPGYDTMTGSGGDDILETGPGDFNIDGGNGYDYCTVGGGTGNAWSCDFLQNIYPTSFYTPQYVRAATTTTTSATPLTTTTRPPVTTTTIQH